MRSEKVKSKTGKIVEGIPGGPYKSIKEAAFARKLKPSNVYNRISNGMSINEALIQNEESNAKKRVECYGKRHSSIKEFALYYDLPLNQVYRRLKWGWEPERIVEELPKSHK